MESGTGTGEKLLTIENLAVSFPAAGGGEAHALRGIDLAFEQKEIHGLVGESGSGKTVTSTCVMGLLPVPPARVKSGRVLFEGRDILSLPEQERRTVRGQKIAMVFQEPGKYLNPAFRIGEQITEMLILHRGMDKGGATDRAVELLGLVGLGRDGRVLSSYPHELSGGMKQRAMIAIAVCCNPRFLIADEPTTALDVTLQLQILRLIADLKELFSMGILFISHDLGIVYEVADRVSVIYAGRIVETAEKDILFGNPLHPYTRLLMASIPDARKRGTRLTAIPGRVPDSEHIPLGCAFHPRCPIADELCSRELPLQEELEPRHFAACHHAGNQWNI
jgi:oligopeptide/dipeptide ABC transporter ATP-binding protein